MPATVEARSRRYRVAAIISSTAGAGRQGPTRWFADPYSPRLVYVLANDGVHRSDDGGASWVLDSSLTADVTDGACAPLAWATRVAGGWPREVVADSG
jgi:hypothetical protein